MKERGNGMGNAENPMGSTQNPMGSADNPLARNFGGLTLLKFATPTILMMLFMGLYTITDTVFVSRFVSTDALSAINMVCPVINIIVGLGGMLATGGSAGIARKIGAGRSQETRQDFTFFIAVGAGLGLAIAVIGIIFLDNIVWGLGASAVLFPYCRSYLFVLLLFTPASILQVLFQNLMVTAGHPGLGMVLSVSAGLVNVALDYIFIVIMHMGIAGSALGTGIGYVLPAAIGLIFFARSRGTLRFERPGHGMAAAAKNLRILAGSLLNGSSELVSQSAAAVTTFLFNGTMLSLMGEDGVAAITILIYTQFMLTALYMGFSMGVAPVISYNHGSGNHVRQRKIFKICLIFIAGASILTFTLSMIFASPLVAIFSPKGSPVYAIAREGFKIFPFSFLFCGFNIFASSAFTALSNGKVSAMISFLRTFGLITVFLLVLPRILGVTGVWMAVPLAETVTVGVAVWMLCKRYPPYG